MVLDVAKAEGNHLHIDIINGYFGYSLRGHMQADWRPKGVSDWMIWFPKILINRDGSPKAKDGWCNVLYEDENIIREYNVEVSDINEHSANVYKANPYRLTFAFNQKDNNYYFKGVFVSDQNKSKANDHYFTRIATKVELIGTPVRDIKLIDCNVEPLDDTHSKEEIEQHAMSLPEEALKQIAKTRSNNKTVIVKETIARYRDPYISCNAKRRAKGICQLCGKPAPFNDKSGDPYLESHHIKWLSKGGEDSPYNVVALCPNCHRKMHIVNDSEDVKFLCDIAEKDN